MRPYTPTEKGVPLPVISKTTPRGLGLKERHHAWHPRSDFRGRPDTGTYALRGSRHQALWVDDHDNYHDEFRGPEIPRSREDMFGAVVMCASGYIPKMGLRMSRGNYLVEPVTRDVRRRMWRQREVGLSFSSVKGFITAELGYFHGVSDTDELIVEEFLETKNQARRLLLAKAILLQAARVAVDPIRSDYESAWRKGQLPRAIDRGDNKLMSVPSSAEAAVFKHAFFTQYQHEGVVKRAELAVLQAA